MEHGTKTMLLLSVPRMHDLKNMLFPPISTYAILLAQACINKKEKKAMSAIDKETNTRRKESLQVVKEFVVKQNYSAERAMNLLFLLLVMELEDTEKIRDFLPQYETHLNAACWESLCKMIEHGEITVSRTKEG